MKIYEWESSLTVDDINIGGHLHKQIEEDSLTISTINLVSEDHLQSDIKKLSVKIPAIPVSLIIKQLKRLVAEEEFRKVYQDRFDQLTSREIEVLRLLSIGYNNREISEKLFISRRTVEQHHKNLNKKLSVKSYADLINYSLAFDLI